MGENPGLADSQGTYGVGMLETTAALTDLHHRDTGNPTYDGLPLPRYVSLFEMLNPMHRLWADGRWNKLTVARGCYWKKCSFCDVTLDYIGRYDPASADLRRAATELQRAADASGDPAAFSRATTAAASAAIAEARRAQADPPVDQSTPAPDLNGAFVDALNARLKPSRSFEGRR